MKPAFKSFVAVIALGIASLASAGNYAALYSASQLSDSFKNCSQFFPANLELSAAGVDKAWRPKELCSDAFAVLYSSRAKAPLAVVERLTREAVSKQVKRGDDFYEDPRISRKDSALLSDFRGSGFDRGHMSPAANQPTENAMAQSMALSNIVLQDPQNNQKTWRKIEEDVRKYVERAQGPVLVITGPLFDRPNQGASVWMPSRLFKLVYDETTGRSWAYLQDNAPGPINPPVSYAEFRKATGWKFLDKMPMK